MNPLIYFLQKTIGQKIVVAFTGLGLCLFLLIHMAGNLLILSGPKAYNEYAHSLHKLPLFIALELGLALFFIGHILLSLLLFIKNKRASGGAAYKELGRGEKRAGLRHSFIPLQGIILLAFLVLHLLSFKFGPYYETEIGGEKARDIYQLVLENFKKPVYPLGYSLAILVLFAHFLRGFPASFKSLGLGHPVYVSWIEKLAWLFALTASIGFLAPIWYVFIWL